MPSINASGSIEWSRDLDSLQLQIYHYTLTSILLNTVVYKESGTFLK